MLNRRDSDLTPIQELSNYINKVRIDLYHNQIRQAGDGIQFPPFIFPFAGSVCFCLLADKGDFYPEAHLSDAACCTRGPCPVLCKDNYVSTRIQCLFGVSLRRVSRFNTCPGLGISMDGAKILVRKRTITTYWLLGSRLSISTRPEWAMPQ